MVIFLYGAENKKTAEYKTPYISYSAVYNSVSVHLIFCFIYFFAMRVLFFFNQYNAFNYDAWPYFQKTFNYIKLYNTFSVWFNRFYSVVILGIIPLLLQVNDTVEQRTEKRTPFAFGHCLQTWLAVCLNGQVRFQHSAPPL